MILFQNEFRFNIKHPIIKIKEQCYSKLGTSVMLNISLKIRSNIIIK